MTPDRIQEIRNPEAIQARIDNGATVELSADGAVKAMCDLVTARDDIRWLLAALATAEAEGRRQDDEAWKLVRHVLDKFKQDEADGYHTKDREFAISLLSKALELRQLLPQTPHP